MAAGRVLFAQECLRCPVCLDVFKYPVTIPCGHSFCLACIGRCWAQAGARAACPQCRELFEPAPRLCKNSILAQLAEDLASSELRAPGPGEVPRDSRAGHRLRVFKPCLVCAPSHWQKHRGDSAGRPGPGGPWRSTLAQETEAGGQCPQHGRPLALFCRTDQAYICGECQQLAAHHGHDIMDAGSGGPEHKQTKLLLQRGLESQIQAVEGDICGVRKQINLMKISTLRDKEDMMQNFTEMLRAVKASEGKVLQFAENVESASLTQAENKLTSLGAKRADLCHSQQTLDQSVGADGCAQLLQDLQERVMDGDSGSCSSWYAEELPLARLTQAVTEFKQKLTQLCTDHVESIMQRVPEMQASSPSPMDRPRLQPLKPRVRAEFLLYAHELTLDQTTAHRNLCLMSANRKVICKLQPQSYPEGPERFEHFTQVMCQQQFSGGRHYWEVQLSGNRVALGASYQSIPRKGHQSCCLVGRNAVSWCLEWNSARCSAWHNNQKSVISKSHHDHLGVFLDYSAGTLSFHEVADAMPLIHSFQASFSQALVPIFFVSWNSFVTIGMDTTVSETDPRPRMFLRQASAEF